MPTATPSDLPRYLVEWYCPELTEDRLHRHAAILATSASAVTERGETVELLMTVEVPSDEIVFGVFAAISGESVSRVCSDAGYPAQRLSRALESVRR